jgi:presenilin-like A22 family membrane protease
MVWDGITYNMVSETGYGIWVWYGIVGWITEQDSIHTYTLGANTHKHTHTRMYVGIHVHRCLYVYIYIAQLYNFLYHSHHTIFEGIYNGIYTHTRVYLCKIICIYIYKSGWNVIIPPPEMNSCLIEGLPGYPSWWVLDISPMIKSVGTFFSNFLGMTIWLHRYTIWYTHIIHVDDSIPSLMIAMNYDTSIKKQHHDHI